MKNILLGVCGVIVGVVIVLGFRGQSAPLSSVTIGNEYHSTTTNQNMAIGTLYFERQLCSTAGSLGSVVVPLTSTAGLELYDATTTNHGDHATSSLAEFKTTTVGDYTFDTVFTRGLILVSKTAVGLASSTITYRCN